MRSIRRQFATALSPARPGANQQTTRPPASRLRVRRSIVIHRHAQHVVNRGRETTPTGQSGTRPGKSSPSPCKLVGITVLRGSSGPRFRLAMRLVQTMGQSTMETHSPGPLARRFFTQVGTIIANANRVRGAPSSCAKNARCTQHHTATIVIITCSPVVHACKAPRRSQTCRSDDSLGIHRARRKEHNPLRRVRPQESRGLANGTGKTSTAPERARAKARRGQQKLAIPKMKRRRRTQLPRPSWGICWICGRRAHWTQQTFAHCAGMHTAPG